MKLFPQGTLPRRYLKDGNTRYGASALISNAKQLELQIRGSRMLSHGPNSEPDSKEITLAEEIRKAEYLLTSNEVLEAIDKGEYLTSFAKESLVYFREYHRGRLISYLTVSWLGWIALLFFKIIGHPRNSNYTVPRLSCDVLFVCTIVLLLFMHRGKWDQSPMNCMTNKAMTLLFK